MATGFIEQLLSDEYREYTDFVQPVLVALYEIKLGLALILSGITQKIILSRVEMANTDMLMVFFLCFYVCGFWRCFVALMTYLESLTGITLLIHEIPPGISSEDHFY